MQMQRLPQQYGPGVCGDHFWPRPALCRQIITSLQRGECVQLFGPRRTGKTSLLKECARRLRDDPNYTVIEINGEGMDTVSTLFNQFVAALPPNSRQGLMTRIRAFTVPDALLKVIESFSGHGGAGREDSQLVSRHGASLAMAIKELLPNMQPRPVLFIDELPYLCKDLHGNSGNPDEVRRLLAMLRDWRGAGLGMAMAGSIGIRQFLRRIKVSRNHLSGCPPVHVGPLERDDARLMLAALAAERDIAWWNDDISETILDQSTDLLPACLQFAFRDVSNAIEDAIEMGKSPSLDVIQRVFQDQIRPNFDQEFHNQYDERFAGYDHAEQSVAREVFRCIARATRSPPSRPFDDLADAVEAKLGADQDRTPADADAPELANLILALEDDGFLTDDRDRDRIGFASRLVEAWWRTRDHRRGRRRRVPQR